MRFLNILTLVVALLHLMCQKNDAFSSIRINTRPVHVLHNSKLVVYQGSKSFEDHISTLVNLNLSFGKDGMVKSYRNMVAKLNEKFSSKINMQLSNGNSDRRKEDGDKNKDKIEILLKEIVNLKTRVGQLERELATTKTNSPFLSTVMNNFLQQKKIELGRDFFIFRVANTSVVQKIALTLGFLIIGAALASLLSTEFWYFGAFIGAVYGLLAGNFNSNNNLDNTLSPASRIQKYMGKSMFWFLQFLRYQLERQSMVPLAETQTSRSRYSSWITLFLNRRNFKDIDRNISIDDSRNASIVTSNMESLKANWLKSQEKLQDWQRQNNLGNIWDQCVDNASILRKRIHAQLEIIMKGITPRREKDQIPDRRYPFALESTSETDNSDANKIDLFDALLLLQRYAIVSFGVFLTMDVAQRVYSAIRASQKDKK